MKAIFDNGRYIHYRHATIDYTCIPVTIKYSTHNYRNRNIPVTVDKMTRKAEKVKDAVVKELSLRGDEPFNRETVNDILRRDFDLVDPRSHDKYWTYLKACGLIEYWDLTRSFSLYKLNREASE